ncbi:apolipoprotein N-acyltransferase [Streptomyces yaizuensis]|uniref:Apolipoprotein N-acyltransferase n=1 Tax=Streptomyces yaizuensis TaxID=2989713 RepID=A0ABQ5NZD6_9ACTN|nr:apolipoprotein N-acyltransferase [Streptomyces sp. YSPA8]GLF95719.1 apolipoprotein N-acyltransferase [Streptomyces sp. YSPA8]
MRFASGGAEAKASGGRAVAALAAGALPALAFPEPSLWWLAYVALVPWLLLLRTAPTARRAAFEGWLGGLGFVVAVHHWLIPSLHVFTVLLGALLGLAWAPWGWLVRALLRRPGTGQALAALAAVPSGWLLIELLRSWEGLGGPWGLLGASQWQVAPALRLASVGGVWLVSLLVVAVNTAITEVIALPRTRTAVLAATACCALLTGTLAAAAPRPGETGRARIALVQPGVLGGPDGAERRFDRAEELTRSLAGRAPDLVVWGESSVGADLGRRPDLARRLAALSRHVGAELLVNVDARRPGDGGGIFKSAVLVGPGGPTGDRYDKMRLVPFGEYVPARSLLGWATSVGRAAGEDRLRGAGPVVLTPPGGGPRLGPLVCFESAFPDMSRRLVRDGAELLVVQSATSTFQGSWAPGQHASLAALRAAESGRPVAHATLTGVSVVHRADGVRTGPALSTETSAAVVYEVGLTRGTTAYVRFGDWPVAGAAAVLAALACAAGVRRAGRVRRGPSAPGSAARRARTARG